MPFDGITPQTRLTLVDDDLSVLRSMSRLLTLSGYDVTTFASSEAFVASLDHVCPDVLLMDLRMPVLDGLAVQSIIRALGYQIPTIFLSAHADVSSSVRALRDGAVDFLEKTCDEPTLLAALSRAETIARRERELRASRNELAANWRTLTTREREVLRWVVTGRLNKQIAATLGTTEKTVKVHRARVMAKMQADSVASLVRMYDMLSESWSAAPRSEPAQPALTRAE
jgi:FixJ family two-component response regulator